MMTRKIGWRHSRFLFLVISGFALLLTGCAVGPDYETPEIEAVPDAWQNAAAVDIADSNSVLQQGIAEKFGGPPAFKALPTVPGDDPDAGDSPLVDPTA